MNAGYMSVTARRLAALPGTVPAPAGMSEQPHLPGLTATAEALIAQSQQGSREAFGQLVERFGRRIFNYLCQLTGNAHDAEDLTQETFLKAWRSVGRCRSPEAFNAWLFTIARRTALNYLRARKPAAMDAAAEEIDPASPAQRLEQQEQQQGLWALARRLGAAQHQALWLRYGEGLSIAETARLMRTSQVHVRVLLHRGRARLARLLAQRVHRESLQQ